MLKLSSIPRVLIWMVVLLLTNSCTEEPNVERVKEDVRDNFTSIVNNTPYEHCQLIGSDESEIIPEDASHRLFFAQIHANCSTSQQVEQRDIARYFQYEYTMFTFGKTFDSWELLAIFQPLYTQEDVLYLAESLPVEHHLFPFTSVASYRIEYGDDRGGGDFIQYAVHASQYQQVVQLWRDTQNAQNSSSQVADSWPLERWNTLPSWWFNDEEAILLAVIDANIPISPSPVKQYIGTVEHDQMFYVYYHWE